MNFCYDLQRCPPTFDVVTHLALLEGERIARGAEHVDMHILPGPAGGFRRDSLWPPTIEERVAMRDRVCAPLCWLLPSVRTVTVRQDRAVEGWGKNEYVISLPGIMKALRHRLRPLRAKGKLVGRTRPYVTLTLRETPHHQLRNSRMPEWVAAAEDIERLGYDVMVIRDAARATEPLDCAREDGAIWQLPEAARDIAVRATVYASAALNVGVSNGPMWMAIFMDAPVLMLRPTTNAAHGCYDDAFHRRWGLERGQQLPTSPAHQRLVWGDDDSRDAIVREVVRMLEDMHKGG